MNTIQQAQKLGQSIWLDYIRRGLIKSGELKRLIDAGVTGLTANPTIYEKAIIESTDYDDELPSLAKAGRTGAEIYETLAVADIRQTADMLRPVYERSGGADGYPCLEITPLVADNKVDTVREGRRLFAALACPNVMVKVPATPEGIPAIRQLIAEGVNVNVTLIFSLEMYDKVKEAFVAGLEDLIKNGGDPAKVASVASFFLSRIDTAVDNRLAECTKRGGEDCLALAGRAAIASARLAYRRFKETFSGERFAALARRQARPQRLLWASTGTKNPAYRDLMYVELLIGPGTVNTMPLATLQTFLDHGKVAKTIESGLEEAEKTFELLAGVGLNLKEITATLLADGVKAFQDSYLKLMAGIEVKKTSLVTKNSP